METFLQKVRTIVEDNRLSVIKQEWFKNGVDESGNVGYKNQPTNEKNLVSERIKNIIDLNIGDLYFDVFDKIDVKDIFLVVYKEDYDNTRGKTIVARVALSPQHLMYHTNFKNISNILTTSFSSLSFILSKDDLKYFVKEMKYKETIEVNLLKDKEVIQQEMQREINTIRDHGMRLNEFKERFYREN